MSKGIIWALLIATAYGGLAEIMLIGMALWSEIRLRTVLLVNAYGSAPVRLPEHWRSGACGEVHGRLRELQDAQGAERYAAQRARTMRMR